MRTLGYLILLLCSTLSITATATAAEQAALPPLTKDAAALALQEFQGEVLSVSPSEIPGLYLVAVKMQGRNIPLYLDASATYMFSGNIIDLKQRRNLTEDLFRELNPVDVSTIPLEDALILGDPQAPQQTIVFTDPHCPYCSQLHQVLHEAVKADPGLAFQIKLLPMQPSSQRVSQTIICNKSMDQLEQAFAGEALPEANCESDVLEKNSQLAQSLQISGTPTLILPNGQIHAGYRPLAALLELLAENAAAPN